MAGSEPQSEDRRGRIDPARDLVSTRLLAAPREQVFEAFADPAHLARWWGPRGFRNTFQAFELWPGGAWRYVMHGPDGADLPNEGVFTEVVRPERIVFRHLGAHRFDLLMTFAEEAGGTRLTWRMRHETAEAADAVRPFVLPANEQNFDRLEAELATMA